MEQRILLCLNHLGGSELKYVHEAFDGNWVVPLGPNVAGFELALKRFLTQGDATLASKEVVALCSGTAAVHLALIACGVRPGDEVIVQSFTFAASVNPIAYLGARPVFVDSEPQTWNMDPRLLDLAIRTRIRATGRKPRAIVAVHLYGMPSRLDEIMAIADKYGIPIVEDAAEAMGSQYGGQECGTFGRYGVLSFNGNKMITTSGGGALVCPDAQARDMVMFYATQAREGYPYYQHEAIGYNYRLSNISAAIGQGQMEILEEHLAHHRMIAATYQQEFADCPKISMHLNPSQKYDSNYWLCNILVSPDAYVEGQERAYTQTISGAIGGAAGVTHGVKSPTTDCQPNANIEAIRLALAARRIESRPLWKPMHKQPVYQGMPAYVNGTCEALFKQGLCLPAGPYVSADDARRIAQLVKGMVN